MGLVYRRGTTGYRVRLRNITGNELRAKGPDGKLPYGYYMEDTRGLHYCSKPTAQI